jgi:hypothetical protein
LIAELQRTFRQPPAWQPIIAVAPSAEFVASPDLVSVLRALVDATGHLSFANGDDDVLWNVWKAREAAVDALRVTSPIVDAG